MVEAPLMRRKRDHDKAIADYNEAIRLKPDFAEAYNARGNAYDEKGDHDKAIADYNEAIRLKPGLAEAYYNRGLAYRRKGDLDKAIADYTEAIRLKPDNAPAYHNRGIAYRKKGDLDKAIADYNEAIRLDPKSAIAYQSRYLAYEEKGDTAKAAEDFARMRQLAAQQPKSLKVIAPISAPIVYENLMLVLSNEDGAAAIAFTTEIEYGVKYRYRYLPKHGKEETGDGEVFEKYKRDTRQRTGRASMVDEGRSSLSKLGRCMWHGRSQKRARATSITTPRMSVFRLRTLATLRRST